MQDRVADHPFDFGVTVYDQPLRIRDDYSDGDRFRHRLEHIQACFERFGPLVRSGKLPLELLYAVG